MRRESNQVTKTEAPVVDEDTGILTLVNKFIFNAVID